MLDCTDSNQRSDFTTKPLNVVPMTRPRSSARCTPIVGTDAIQGMGSRIGRRSRADLHSRKRELDVQTLSMRHNGTYPLLRCFPDCYRGVRCGLVGGWLWDKLAGQDKATSLSENCIIALLLGQRRLNLGKGSFMEASTTSMRDGVSARACSNCGTPHASILGQK